MPRIAIFSYIHIKCISKTSINLPDREYRGTMAPPKGGNVLSVLAKFRTDQVKAAKVQAEASKEREEKLKKVQSGGKRVQNYY